MCLKFFHALFENLLLVHLLFSRQLWLLKKDRFFVVRDVKLMLLAIFVPALRSSLLSVHFDGDIFGLDIECELCHFPVLVLRSHSHLTTQVNIEA